MVKTSKSNDERGYAGAVMDWGFKPNLTSNGCFVDLMMINLDI